MIWEAIQRYHHGWEVVKRRAVPLWIAYFEERVEGADRAGIAFGRIPPVGNDVIDERIVEHLTGLVVYGADVGKDGIDEGWIEPASIDEGLQRLAAIVARNGVSSVISER